MHHFVLADNESCEHFTTLNQRNAQICSFDFYNLLLSRADWSQGTPAIIRCRIFCLPLGYPKI